MDAVLGANEAVLDIRYDGQQGTAPNPVPFDATDNEVLQWAAESLRAGEVPGIDAVEADLDDFVVDRYNAKDGLPNRLSIRAKTPFGKTPLGK